MQKRVGVERIGERSAKTVYVIGASRAIVWSSVSGCENIDLGRGPLCSLRGVIILRCAREIGGCCDDQISCAPFFVIIREWRRFGCTGEALPAHVAPLRCAAGTRSHRHVTTQHARALRERRAGRWQSTPAAVSRTSRDARASDPHARHAGRLCRRLSLSRQGLVSFILRSRVRFHTGTAIRVRPVDMYDVGYEGDTEEFRQRGPVCRAARGASTAAQHDSPPLDVPPPQQLCRNPPCPCSRRESPHGLMAYACRSTSSRHPADVSALTSPPTGRDTQGTSSAISSNWSIR